MFKFIKIFIFVCVFSICATCDGQSLEETVKGKTNGYKVTDLIKMVLDNNIASFNTMYKDDFLNKGNEKALKTIYYVTRAIKEAANVNCWYKARKYANNKILREVYLFAHVIDGHFLSPNHGRIGDYKSDTSGAWGCTNNAWNSHGYLEEFIRRLARAFQQHCTAEGIAKVDLTGNNICIKATGANSITNDNFGDTPMDLNLRYVSDADIYPYSCFIPDTEDKVLQKNLLNLNIAYFSDMDNVNQSYGAPDNQQELMNKLQDDDNQGGPNSSVANPPDTQVVISTITPHFQ
jgi:hypothetical protein